MSILTRLEKLCFLVNELELAFHLANYAPDKGVEKRF